MRIISNIMAYNANLKLGVNSKKKEKSTEKLSSGLRINRSADDAAGLAISEKMRAQIRGLNQASRNIQDGSSLIQTADGAMQEIHNMLQRQRELVVQGISDTNAREVDRPAIQQEIDQLTKEIDDMANTTKFNDRPLLNVPKGGTMTILPVPPGTAIPVTVPAQTDLAYGYMEVKAGDSFILKATFAENTGSSFPDLNLHAPDGTQYGYHRPNMPGDGPQSMEGTATCEKIEYSGWSPPNGSGNNTEYFKVTVAKDPAGVGRWEIYLQNDPSNETTFEIEADLPIVWYGSEPGEGVETFQDDLIWIQGGANEGDGVWVNLYDCRAKSLEVDPLEIEPIEKGNESLKRIDNAINQVSSFRATAGAQQNRLEYKLHNVDNSAENLAAAESRIRDVDMAKEMAEYVKNDIMTQASTAMLAQANRAPESVLSLLQ